MDCWYHVHQVLETQFSSSNSESAYLLPLLGLTSPYTIYKSANTPSHVVLRLLHTMYRCAGEDVKMYRKIVCRDRLYTTIIPSQIAITNRNTFIMWDDLIQEREYHTLAELIYFLELIQDQIHFSLAEANSATNNYS